MPRPPHYEDTEARIDKLTVGPFENNVFILRSKGTGAATLLDAANEHDLLLEVSRATGVRRVLTTHGHWDHIQAVEAVRTCCTCRTTPDGSTAAPTSARTRA